MLLRANVHPHPIYFLYFFLLLRCLPHNLMLECFYLSLTAESLCNE